MNSTGQQAKTIGPYELLAKLGRGGMGAVYKARQVSMDRIVALKLLPPKLARDAQFVQRFQREARAAGKLSHPNIVAGIDVGEADGFHYFAMEYVEGETLKALVLREKRLDPGRAARIAGQIAKGLAHAHANGLIHRDVKPENVLLTPDGTAKLCDLGLARSTAEDQSITLTGMTVGTPHYISPEQVEGRKDIDDRADLYSLGATLYHTLAGKPPFTASTAAKVMSMHLTDKPKPIHEAAPGTPPELAAIVTRLLRKKPGARYPSASDLAEDLERFESGQVPVYVSVGTKRKESTIKTSPVTRRTGRVGAVGTSRRRAVQRGRRRWLLVAGAVAAGLLVAGVLVIAPKERAPPAAATPETT